MKKYLRLGAIALLGSALSSCDTYVQGSAHTRGYGYNNRGHSSGHYHGYSRNPRPQPRHNYSGTNVRANVNASLGL